MTVIHHAESRRTVTPNATMTTHASPTQGGAGLCMGRVDMEPGASGPAHVFDAELVWTVLDGGASIELDGAQHTVEPGDTLIMPAGLQRQVRADPERGFTAVVAAPAGAKVVPAEGDLIVPAWIA